MAGANRDPVTGIKFWVMDVELAKLVLDWPSCSRAGNLLLFVK
jgi:hypothetical protein